MCIRDREDISRLAIAGGFGSYLSLDSAAAIGLLPPELAPRCDVLGNAALSGAAMLLRSRPLQEESLHMADGAETVDLATNPFFMDQYICLLYTSHTVPGGHARHLRRRSAGDRLPQAC